MRHTFRKMRADDSGSLVLTLLVFMLVTSFVGVLLGTVVAGQRAARFDRDFTLVVQAADLGVQQSVFRLNSVVPDDAVTTLADAGWRTVGNMQYRWSAVRLNDRDWQVTSTGRHNGRERRVRAIVRQERLYFASIFANRGINFAGGNAARSYDSRKPAATAWLTGKGIIATNGDLNADGTVGKIEFGGGSEVDGVELWNFNPLAPQTAEQLLPLRCGGTTTEVNKYCPPAHKIPFRKPIAQVSAQISKACPLAPSSYPPKTMGSGDRLAPGTYCFSSLTLTGTDVPVIADTATPNDPVKIFVLGDISMPTANARVNCPGDRCASDTGSDKIPSTTTSNRPLPPRAAALRIWTTGNIGMKNGLKLAAGIQAPSGICDGDSNSQIYGALICSEFRNKGGWTFFFDEALGDPGNRNFGVAKWWELRKGEA